MDPSLLAILGLLVGLALVVSEFFIPSGGLLGILAAVTLISSTFFAWNAWGTTNSAAFYAFICSLLILTPGSVIGVLWLLPRTQLGNRVLLRAPENAEVTAYSAEAQRLAQLVGQHGKTTTLLNPGGMVTVGGERFHCESRGMLLESGEDVEVIGIKGNRLVVARPQSRPAERPLAESEVTEAEATPTDESSPLDFEIPQEDIPNSSSENV